MEKNIDYFDKICAMPDTVIYTTVALVQVLWDDRLQLLDPGKPDRLKWFYEVFYRFIVDHSKGVRLEYRDHDYLEYLRWYAEMWNITPNTRRVYLRRKRQGAMGLFDDIRENGMRDPLCVVVEPNRAYLYRGYRRLVVAKVLGIDRVKVTYAIVNSDSGAK